MARVRFIGPQPVTVPELGGRTVQPDEVVEVPDARYDGYVCQPCNWEPIEEPKLKGEHGPETVAFTGREPAVPKKSAAKSAAKEV
ncbi:hypothetical protein ACFUJR_32580 [Streptomyces sp. NPDC057271]|uniref:hypothetical protein n=1 Tax=unclassified Streptomyces TaxID=2593676 RepID=UPI00362DF92D